MCLETGSDPVACPFTTEPRGVAQMSFWRFLTSLLGPRISDTTVFTRASQPLEQEITFLFMEMLRDNVTKQGVKVTLSLLKAAPFPTVP